MTGIATNGYVSSVGWAAVAQWSASHVYSLGDYVRQLTSPAYGNECVFKVTTAGTSGASEPSWSTGNGVTTTDNTVTWTEIGGQEGEQSAGNWTAPLGSILAAFQRMGDGGKTVFVDNTHVESHATSYDWQGSLVVPSFVSVNASGANLPPHESDYLRGAAGKTTGNNDFDIRSGYFKGFDFQCGDGASGGPTFTLGYGNGQEIWMDDCTLTLANTNGGKFTVGFGNGNPSTVNLFNFTVTFAAAGQLISLGNGAFFNWSGGGTAGVSPTTLFNDGNASISGPVKLRGLDLSSCSGKIFPATFSSPADVYDCKLNASAELHAGSGGRGSTSNSSKTLTRTGMYIQFMNCDDGTNNTSTFFQLTGRYLTVMTSLKGTTSDPASDGDTPFSHYYQQTVDGGGRGANFHECCVGPWMHKRFNAAGSPVTLTIEAILFNNPNAPTTSDVWLETETLESSASPVGKFTGDRAAFAKAGAGTATTTSTETWDNTAPARQNSHTYQFGDVIKVASNPGRLFMCLTAGGANSASSEPGGYAAAVDGGSFTDGGATMQAGTRVKFERTWTPGRKGVIRARINTFWLPGGFTTPAMLVNPKLNVV